MDVEDEAPPPPAPAAASDPWSALMQTGMALLQQWLTRPASSTSAGNGSAAGSAPGAARPPLTSLVQRDERTGETYLKVPVPSPETISQALSAFGALLQSFRR
jgi:hypothetical protein